MSIYTYGARIVPSAQELSSLPSSTLAAEITNVEACLANRYNPNGTFAELVDEYRAMGKEERRVFWADLVRYRANLYTAQAVQATEAKNGGIGILDANFRDSGPIPNNQGGYGW